MDVRRMKKLIKEGSKEVKDTILPIIVIIIDEVLRLLVVLATPDFFDNGIAMVIFFIQFILSIVFYCFYYGYFFEEKKNPFLRTKKYTQIYDYDKLKSLDKYDIYLSGASSIIDIVNPTSHSNKELIVFRDSYGSSLVPLLIEGYKRITVIDIRYVSSRILNNYIKFKDQDVLFMYSILTINNSFSMR